MSRQASRGFARTSVHLDEAVRGRLWGSLGDDLFKQQAQPVARRLFAAFLLDFDQARMLAVDDCYGY